MNSLGDFSDDENIDFGIPLSHLREILNAGEVPEEWLITQPTWETQGNSREEQQETTEHVTSNALTQDPISLFYQTGSGFENEPGPSSSRPPYVEGSLHDCTGMAPPQWAYQIENFVSKPDEELVCSICLTIFCDPVMCPCYHVFCRACITKWLKSSRNCPICRKQASSTSTKQTVPIIKNLIMKLTLNCHNKNLGCKTQFSVENSVSHMKKCEYELVQCKNEPCQDQLFRKDLTDHETRVCLHRYIECKKLDRKYLLQCYQKNMIAMKVLRQRCMNSASPMKKCEYELVQCKNKPCKDLLFRKDLTDHETRVCSHRYIKCKKLERKYLLQCYQKNMIAMKVLRQRCMKKVN